MAEAEKVVTLSTIAGGAAVERFEEELNKVLRNIEDPNTDPEKKRSIVLKFDLFPSKLRDNFQVIVSSESKVAPVTPADATCFIIKQAGRRVAVAYDPQQGRLFKEQPTGPQGIVPRAAAAQGEPSDD